MCIVFVEVERNKYQNKYPESPLFVDSVHLLDYLDSKTKIYLNKI